MLVSIVAQSQIPTQPLAASRDTRFQAASYGLTRTGFAPIDRASFARRRPSFEGRIAG